MSSGSSWETRSWGSARFAWRVAVGSAVQGQGMTVQTESRSRTICLEFGFLKIERLR